MDRQLNEHDDSALRRLLGVPAEDAEMPADVLTAYWEYRKLYSRLMGAGPIPPEALCFIALSILKDRGPITNDAPGPAVDLGTLQADDEVSVLFRKKELVAKVIEVVAKRNSVKVLIEGEEDSREVKADTVLGVLSKAGG